MCKVHVHVHVHIHVSFQWTTIELACIKDTISGQQNTERKTPYKGYDLI